MVEVNQEVPLLVHAETLGENFSVSDSTAETLVGPLAASSLLSIGEEVVSALKSIIDHPSNPSPLTLLVDGLDEIESSEHETHPLSHQP